MFCFRPVSRVLFVLSVLAGGICVPCAGMVATPARAARAAGGLVRYTSTSSGYTVLLPTSWVRLTGVHWTPGGPAANLTAMTPDHQAALGIHVTPTGNRVYSDAELLGVATRLLYQENTLPPGASLQTKKIAINHVSYQVVVTYQYSGLPVMDTLVSIAVAQRHHRLYVLSSLVYLEAFTTQAAGSGLEATPTPGASTGLGLSLGAVPLSVGPRSAGGSPARHGNNGLVPLPTDRLRGNQCRTADDATVAVIDKNCAAPQEEQTLATVLGSFTISSTDPREARPEALVGPDGFARFSDSTLGVSLAYPAHWGAMAVAGATLVRRSSDHTALVALSVHQGDTTPATTAALRSVAARAIAQIGNPLGTITYHTTPLNGVLYVGAFAPSVGISGPNGGAGQAQVGIVVASYRHRLYTVVGVALTVGSGFGGPTPVLFPYFAPFTTLARVYQRTLDTTGQETALALQSVVTLLVDPHVQDTP